MSRWIPEAPIDRLKRKIEIAPSTGCWNWTAARYPNGYAKFFMLGRHHLAHRAAYELLNGPIPAGLVLDHLCRNRACVNPAHLEPVTQAENCRRNPDAGRPHSTSTHCVHGHAFTPANTVISKRGWRTCRECELIRKRNRRALLGSAA